MQRTVRARANPRMHSSPLFSMILLVALNQFLAQLVHVLVCRTCQHFAKCGQSRRHRDRIRVVRTSVEDAMVRRSAPITSRVEANAASENPPPIDFARQMMSGFTSKYSQAPP